VNPFDHLSIPTSLSAIDNLAHLVSDGMRLGDARIPWVSSIKYLRIYILGGKNLSFNIRPAKQSFFTACNCVYAKALSVDEIINLTLQSSNIYCLSILTDAIAALRLDKTGRSIERIMELGL
jgi:hypothetical protein